MKKLFRILWNILGIIYYPVYLVFCIYYRLVRILLAIAYFGMLDFKMAKDVIKYTFKKTYGRR